MQGRSGIPGGAGSGYGVLALLVVRPEAREVPAEQRPAHHTQPTLLPLPGVSLCSPAGGQTAGEMWPVSVVRERDDENSLLQCWSADTVRLCLTATLLFFFCSLLNLCSVKNQDSVLKLAVATLDYSRDGLARVILSKILTAATDVSHEKRIENTLQLKFRSHQPLLNVLLNGS